MSRIGKHPVVVPAGVQVAIDGQKVSAKGKQGELSVVLAEEVLAKLENGKVVVQPRGDSRRARMMWATSRSLINNLVIGVNQGYTVNLEINGVGYRAAVQGKDLVLQLGFSHDVKFPIPDGVVIKTEKPTSISIFGRDKQQVGQVAANIRDFRSPEPYKGKGIKYVDEVILRKEGKKK
jgi:large subunit ribosomal protein L6